jgi:hypothetical protein
MERIEQGGTHAMSERRESTEEHRVVERDRREAPPTWQNTQPRGNGVTDHRDLERSVARFEAVLGR